MNNNNSPPADAAPCPNCGASLGGGEGCDAAFHELGARAYADVAFAYRRRAVCDAYCLQHPKYILTLNSFGVHLCGLCAAMERANDPRAERALWTDLHLPASAVKPALPASFGTRTVEDLYRAADGAAFRSAVDAWLPNVWSAWEAYHGLARRWLDYTVEEVARHVQRR
jgi:hypothetical protein